MCSTLKMTLISNLYEIRTNLQSFIKQREQLKYWTRKYVRKHKNFKNYHISCKKKFKKRKNLVGFIKQTKNYCVRRKNFNIGKENLQVKAEIY